MRSGSPRSGQHSFALGGTCLSKEPLQIKSRELALAMCRRRLLSLRQELTEVGELIVTHHQQLAKLHAERRKFLVSSRLSTLRLFLSCLLFLVVICTLTATGSAYGVISSYLLSFLLLLALVSTYNVWRSARLLVDMHRELLEFTKAGGSRPSPLVTTPPGSLLSRIATILLGKKQTTARIEPCLADMQEEYFAALLAQDETAARAARIRGTVTVLSHIVQSLPGLRALFGMVDIVRRVLS